MDFTFHNVVLECRSSEVSEILVGLGKSLKVENYTFHDSPSEVEFHPPL